MNRLKSFWCEGEGCALLSSIRIKQGISIDMCIELGKEIPTVAKVIMTIVDSSKETIPIPFQEYRNASRHYLTVSISPNEFTRPYPRWYLCVIGGADGCDGKSFSVKTTRWIKLKFMLHRLLFRLNDGSSYVPHITPFWKSLQFIRRELSDYENRFLRIREVISCVTYYATQSYWNRRKLILMYDRPARAQDNAEYLFSYIMQHTPGDVRKRVFFVIDKKCPDYQRVACYGNHVVPFMSLRYLVYLQAARYMIGSHPYYSAYLKDAMPSLVTRDLYKKPLFNLQHGVIALKNVANILEAKRFPQGSKLLASSEWERSIVCDHLGWNAKDVPVLGLARWDVLESRTDTDTPFVLYMPTFRHWLYYATRDRLAKSEFACAINSLLHSERLQHILVQNNATLKFYCHPAMHEKMSLFEQNIPNVEFIHEGGRPLNELIMECSCMITDYSSICCDAFFIKKPVIFYQFDQERFLSETGSYFDFNQLPGTLCLNEEATLDALTRSFKTTGHTEEMVTETSHWFKYHDHNNCQRIFTYLKQEGWF